MAKEKKNKTRNIFPISKPGCYVLGSSIIGLVILFISLLIVWNLRAIHFFMRSVLIHIIWYLLIGGVIISILCLIYHWIWVGDADENLVMNGRVTSLKMFKTHIAKALLSLYSLLGFLLTIGILYLHEIYFLFNETSNITITPKEFIAYSIIIWIFWLIISFLIHYVLFEYEMRCIKANAKQQKGADK